MRFTGIISGLIGLAALGAPLLGAEAQSGGSGAKAEPGVIWLDELDVKQSSCGWAETRRKKSVGGNPLRMRGTPFERGIGTHPPGVFKINLAGNGIRFEATVGIDDETGRGGTAEFRVVGDRKLLWTSGVLRGGGEIKTCNVELKGIKTLELVVDTTPDGYANDHTDWAMAKIQYTGKVAPAAVKSISVASHRWPPAEQVYHKASLPDPADRDEADAVLRRTEVLIEHLKTLPGCPNLAAEEQRLRELKAESQRVEIGDEQVRARFLGQCCQLRRKVAFANPLLDFDKILFIKRHFCPNAETTGNHMCDQYFGFNAIRGGGLFVLEKPFSEKPTVRDLLEQSVCKNGRFQGKKLTSDGGFLSPELSFDAKKVLFAWTEIADKEADRMRYRKWTERNTYKIFQVNVDGSDLTQLTDGAWNDFDPCYLPNGRIVFISERRGGYGRCHGRPVPSFTLHAMNADGSAIVCLSPHETNEWQPSVHHDGMIVYTRWDYVDRGFNQAHHPWITTPDGRDPRVIHGNYPTNQGHRPHSEISIRAVPNSNKLIATAACHHGQAYGSIVLIDPKVPDDDKMGPVKRLTPDQGFPEAEVATHRGPANYAAPYPLSEHFFLCVYDPESRSDAGTQNNYGIYLVDVFGNKELIYRDPAISCLDPIPLKARPVPPIIPDQIDVAKQLLPRENSAASQPDACPDYGVVGVANVNSSLLPMPRGEKITHLRIVQLLPKTTPIADNPPVGYGPQKSARMVLGTVPVEEDGSAYFKMPANRPVYFQALDTEGMAVQSMRSATYVHAGEKLFCRGCHEPASSSMAYQMPRAWGRKPSEITPDVAGSRPFSYPILVQPVLEKNCVSCHQKVIGEGKKVPDLTRGQNQKNQGKWYTSYVALRPYAFFWNDAVFDSVSQTTPGKFGAKNSRLYQMLTKGHHDVKLSKEDLHRLTLWLDCNSNFYGSYENLQDQLDAQIVWPRLE